VRKYSIVIVKSFDYPTDALSGRLSDKNYKMLFLIFSKNRASKIERNIPYRNYTAACHYIVRR